MDWKFSLYTKYIFRGFFVVIIWSYFFIICLIKTITSFMGTKNVGEHKQNFWVTAPECPPCLRAWDGPVLLEPLFISIYPSALSKWCPKLPQHWKFILFDRAWRRWNLLRKFVCTTNLQCMICWWNRPPRKMTFPWLTKTCWGKLLFQYFMCKVYLYNLKKNKK